MPENLSSLSWASCATGAASEVSYLWNDINFGFRAKELKPLDWISSCCVNLGKCLIPLNLRFLLIFRTGLRIQARYTWPEVQMQGQTPKHLVDSKGCPQIKCVLMLPLPAGPMVPKPNTAPLWGGTGDPGCCQSLAVLSRRWQSQALPAGMRIQIPCSSRMWG